MKSVSSISYHAEPIKPLTLHAVLVHFSLVLFQNIITMLFANLCATPKIHTAKFWFPVPYLVSHFTAQAEKGKHPYYTNTHTCASEYMGQRTIFPIPRLSLGLCILLSSAIFKPPIQYSSIYSSSHTFIGGLSRVGIHQGPSLSPAMPQRQGTMVGQRQSSLLMSMFVGVCVRG